MTPFTASTVGMAVMVLVLTTARVIELLNGHGSDPALTASFSASVAATITLMAVDRARNGR